LLTQESTSKEVELHEDDPKAMMVLLRYLYGTPYPTTNQYDESFIEASLQDHARVFVVAEKYQIPKLRDEAFGKMKDVLDIYALDFDESACEDFAPSLHAILTGTTSSSTVRKLMIEVFIDELRHLRLNDAFLALLPELPELAIEILKHPHLRWEPPGEWTCDGLAYLHGGEAMCGFCGYDEEHDKSRPFEKSFAWQCRKRDIWPCPRCSQEIQPLCSVCRCEIFWEEFFDR
jgi:hypothetical protein